MDKYLSTPRRIWRILYPPLIFIGMQIVIMAIIIVIVSISLGMSGGGFEFTQYGVEQAVEDVLALILEHAVLLQLIINLICFSVFIPMWLKTRKFNDIWKNDKPVFICLLTAGLFVAYNVIQSYFFSLLDMMRYFPAYEEVVEFLKTDSFFIQFLAIGIVAPIIEEIVFRGILMSRMQWLSVRASVLIQGALFGIVHLNLFQSLYAFAAGILLGLVYVKFRSIIVVIAGHMAFNTVSIVLDQFSSEEIAVAVVILCSILLPICVFFTIKCKKANRVFVRPDVMPMPAHQPTGPRAYYQPSQLLPPDENQHQPQGDESAPNASTHRDNEDS